MASSRAPAVTAWGSDRRDSVGGGWRTRRLFMRRSVSRTLFGVEYPFRPLDLREILITISGESNEGSSLAGVPAAGPFEEPRRGRRLGRAPWGVARRADGAARFGEFFPPAAGSVRMKRVDLLSSAPGAADPVAEVRRLRRQLRRERARRQAAESMGEPMTVDLNGPVRQLRTAHVELLERADQS